MPFLKINTEDQDMQLFQDNVDKAFGELQSNRFIGGNLLSGVALVAGQNNDVAHGLQRQPQIWVITDQTAAATVHRTAWDENYLTLRCSVNCTVSLWVS